MTAATRRFLAAIVISSLLHVLAISSPRLRLPAPDLPPPPPLQARLASSAPAAPAAAPRRKSRPAPRIAAPAPPAVAAGSDPVLAPEQPAAAAAPLAPAVSPSEPAPPPAVRSAEQAPPPVAKNLPRKGRITYTLFLGADKFIVGRAVQSWESANGRYKLGSVAETTGIADLLHSQHLNYLSEGRITDGGLQPDTFLMSRKRRGETEVAKARFDWESAQLTLGRVGQQRSTALPAASQDMVSLFYQLALAPPAPGRLLRLPVTNGSDLDFHEIEVLEPESIDTPLGVLKALPFRQVRQPDKESIEFWLAADYGYLPVRIRFIGRDGTVSGEQMVNEIRISEE